MGLVVSSQIQGWWSQGSLEVNRAVMWAGRAARSSWERLGAIGSLGSIGTSLAKQLPCRGLEGRPAASSAAGFGRAELLAS